MGDWSDNLEYEQREYYGHLYDPDNDCASKFQMVGIGQAEIELIVTDGEDNE